MSSSTSSHGTSNDSNHGSYGIVNAEIEHYVLNNIKPESTLLKELRLETHKLMPNPQMLSGPQVGTLLQLLIKLSKAKKIIELGMFTGYSALSMAEALPEDGKVVTTEINPKAVNMARTFFDRSAHGKKIDVKMGPALATLEGLTESYDFAFVDADKENYLNYYKALLPKIKQGGLIVFDNALRAGKVLNPTDAGSITIADLNRYIQHDSSVINSLITVRDGLNVVYKI